MRINSKMAKSRRRGPKDSCIKLVKVKVFNILLFFFLIRLPLCPLGSPGSAGYMGHYCQYASRVPDSGYTMLVRASRRKFLSFGAWLERYYRLLLSYSGSFNLFRAICPNGTIVVSTQFVKVIIRP